MKKFLLFLLLFGAGLAVLFILQGPQEGAGNGRGPTEEGSQGGPGVTVPIREDGAESDAADSGQFVKSAPAGDHDLVNFDSETGAPRFSFKGFLRPQPNAVVLVDDVVINIYDDVTGTIQVQLNADLAEVTVDFITMMKITPDESKPEDAPPAKPVRLENVDLTILKGAPIVPVNFRVPVLFWSVDDKSFRSDDRIQLTGPGLEAASTGLIATTLEGAEEITLVRDGSIDIDVEKDKVRLDSTGVGPIVFRRIGPVEDAQIELAVEDGAKLTLIDGTTFESRQLQVEAAVVESGEEGNLKLRHASASGDVVATGEAGKLMGGAAEFDFDQAGAPSLIRLSGSPRAELLIKSPSDRVQPEDETTRVEVEGAGPLFISLGSERRFELQGPATTRLPELDLVVTAKERLRGTLDRETEKRTVAAVGDVVITHPRGTLTGSRLDLKHDEDADGNGETDLTVTGPSVFDGTDDKQRRFVVTTDGTLVARVESSADKSVEDRFFITSATDVRFDFASEVEGEEPFTATCGVLRDLDLFARTFTAEGGVTLGIEGGEATALRVLAHGERDLELFGAPGAPATLSVLPAGRRGIEAEDLEASAEYLHLEGDRVEATGSVALSARNGDRTFQMGADTLTLTWLEDPDAATTIPYLLNAGGVDRAGLIGGDQELFLSCSDLTVTGSLAREEGQSNAARVGPFDLDAKGGVKVEFLGTEREITENYAGRPRIEGYGESFTWSLDADDLTPGAVGSGRGRLASDAGKRVRSVGRLAGEDLPYELTAEWIEFDGEKLEALAPVIRIDSTDIPTSQSAGETLNTALLEASGRRLVATQKSVLLSENAHVRGTSQQQYAWKIDAHEIELGAGEADPETKETFASVEARGGFRAVLNDELTGVGDTLLANRKIVRFEGDPARLEGAGFAWESKWIEFDIESEIVTTGSGAIVPGSTRADEGWSIQYESLQPFQEDEVTILALRNAVVSKRDKTLRSNWALFWIDNEEWKKSDNPLVSSGDGELRTETVDLPSDEPERPVSRYNLFDELRTSKISHLLNEIYVEGDVEYSIGEERLVRAESVYIDLVDGHGWIQEADLKLKADLDTQNQHVRVKAEWVRHSANGSLFADSATITGCTHEVPHYVIETGSLSLVPRSDGQDGYEIGLQDNSISLQNGVRLPLPGFDAPTDEEGKVDVGRAKISGWRVPNVNLGSSSRFGTSVETQFSRDLGRIGKFISGSFEDILNLKPEAVDGSWRYNAAYFGSRGVLLGVGFEIKDKERFWFNAYADGIPDRRKDRGLVRVPKDERETFRAWYRARSRYYNNENEWFDFRFTKQSDAGVQSEFFERDFVAFEERETYLHWRKADDQYYYSAEVDLRLDDFLTAVEHVPGLGFQRGLTPLFHLGKTPFLYHAELDADYLRRVQAKTNRGEDPFADGLGDRETARFDNIHRVETPLDLGGTGIRLTPFVEGRATAWSEGVAEDQSSLRLSSMTGAELSSVFWNRSRSGKLHTITPKAGVRVGLGVDESGSIPVAYDEVEESVAGHFIDLGVRSVWVNQERDQFFDVDLTGTHATDVAAPQRGWFASAFSSFRQNVGGVAFGFTHDGRYDVDDRRTIYSRSFFGFEPWRDRLGIETGYHSGRDQNQSRLYEAASVAVRLTATQKWEFEFRQLFDLTFDDSLVSRGIIRRFGHDLIFEIELSQREGEGTSFSIAIDPRIGWRRSTLGLVDGWRRTGGYH